MCFDCRYSFAVLLLEVLAVAHGYSDQYIRERFMNNARTASAYGWRPAAPKKVQAQAPVLWAMVQSCWSQDPLERPSFLQLALEIEGGACSPVASAEHAVTTVMAICETDEDAPESQRGGGGGDIQEQIVLLQAQIKQLRSTKVDDSRAALEV